MKQAVAGTINLRIYIIESDENFSDMTSVETPNMI